MEMPDSPTGFRRIFFAMMLFTALVWAWTVGLMLLWPWQEAKEWQADYRLATVCPEKSEQQACVLTYAAWEKARAAQQSPVLVSTNIADFAEVADDELWYKWRKFTSKSWLYELSWSSWNFEESIRYRVDGDVPVLMAHRRVGVEILRYSLALAVLSFLAIAWSKRRSR